LIREAVDARAHSVPLAERRLAVTAIAAMSGGRFLPTAELERIVDEEREKPIRELRRVRRRR